LPGETHTILTVNVRQILDSALVAKYAPDGFAASIKACPDVAAVCARLGIDRLSSIEQVVVGLGDSDSERDCSAVILRGRFDMAAFRTGMAALAECQPRILKAHRQGRQVYYELRHSGKRGSMLAGMGVRPGEGGSVSPVLSFQCRGNIWDAIAPCYIALVDERTLLLAAERRTVATVFARAAAMQPPAIDKQLRRLLRRVSAQASIVLVGKPTAELRQGLAGALGTADVDLDDFTAAITVADDLRAHVALTCPNAETTKRALSICEDLGTRAEALAVLLTGNNPRYAPFKEVPRAFHARAQGTKVVVEGSITAELIDRICPLLASMVSPSPANLDERMAEYSKALRERPKDAHLYEGRGSCYCARGDYARALADYEQMVRVQPRGARGYMLAAWILATCPDAQLRNGEKALQLATRACRLAGWHDAASLHTLAASLAECGRFDEAVKRAKQAIRRATPTDDRSDGRAFLKLYQQGKPYHQVRQGG
jgi:tetratricopeptide (TPR) repeat protein